MSLASGTLFAGELTGVRLSSGPSATRLVLDLDGPADHLLFQLSDPNRVVIDLPATQAIDGLILPQGKGRVRAVRAGNQPDGELRIVLDLAEKSRPRSFALAPEGQFGHRVVIDLEASDASGETKRKVVDEDTGSDLVIAIDAGHGGKDTGAIHNKLYEKDVTLQIARRLAAQVDAMPGFRPVLIRDSDRYIELDERVRRARAADADFFISIHADAHNSPNVAGATVYSIKTDRAMRETAKLLADRNNVAEIVGSEEILADLDDSVTRVLVEMTRDAAITKSRIAGNAIIDSLSRVTTMLRPEVQQKSLGVLTSPDVPSLLVETGFLTNAREAARLRDGDFQQLLAQALFAGIADFYRECKCAPSGSYIAHHPPPVERPPTRHVIARGETLSEIAERYRISVSALRRTNRINGDVIRIGQVLTIPTSI